MRFRLQTDYALRALVFMAAKDGNCTTDEIAGYYDISSAHLGRVIRRLQRYGYVKAIRGRRGGVRLDREPGSIVLGEVVNRLEEHATPLDPTSGEGPHPVDEASRLKAVLRRAHGMFMNYLQNVTLAELAAEGLPDKERVMAEAAEAARRQAAESATASETPAAEESTPAPEAPRTETPAPDHVLHR